MKAKIQVILSFAMLFLSLSSLSAQQKEGSLSGNVVDSKYGTPVENATVKVLAMPDSNFVSGAVTDSLGNFKIKGLPMGQFLMVTDLLGYEHEKRPFRLTAQAPEIKFNDIEMNPTDILLGDGAIVTANAVQVTVKEDTLIFNANAFRVPEGGMLEDLVKKLPGVEVSDDGKITLNGKELKKVLVDGKEFFSDDPSVSLKNLPANMVNKLKAYDRKSDFARTTGIDDGEEEAVLDLQVKPGMKDGLVGNVFGGYGNKERYEAAGNVNRFRNDSHLSVVINANNTNNQGYSEMGDSGRGRDGNSGSGITESKSFATSFAKDFSENLKLGGDIRYGNSDNDAYMKRNSETQYNDSTREYTRSNNSSNRKRDDFNFNFRLEWKPDTLTTMIFRPRISFSKTHSTGSGESLTWNDTTNVNSNKSDNDSRYKNLDAGGSFNIIRRLNSKGRNVSFNINYSYGQSTSDIYSNSDLKYFLQPNRSKDYKRYTDGESFNHNLRIGVSYSEPLFDRTFLQLSYNFSYRNSRSNKYGYEQDGDANLDWDSFPIDSAKRDLSSCYKNIYLNHRINIGMRHIGEKYNLSYGVSLNPQSSQTNNIFGPNMDKGLRKQDVVNWSPNLDFRYRFTKQNQLRFEYRGRSDAPSIDDLQEVISRTDPQNIQYGNPLLKPSFTHRVNASYNGYNVESRRSIVARAFFNTTQNSTARMTLYDPQTGNRVSKLMNVNGNWSTNAMLGFNTPLDSKNRFNVNTYTRASYSESVSFNTTTLSDIDFSSLESEDLDHFISIANKNLTHNLRLSERLVVSYRNDWFEITLNGSIAYNRVKSNLQNANDRETFDYLGGGSTNVTLPWNIYVSTDCNYTHRQGYSEGLKKDQVMWNAQISKSFLKNNAATLRFKIYDILRDQNNVQRNISALTITDTEYNTLGSYFMVNFIWKFNTLGQGASSRGNRGGRGGDRPMGPPPGGFGGPGGYHGPMM